MNDTKIRIRRFLAFLILAFPAGLAHAQAYPSRPVRVIVPFAPGGVADSSARVVSERLGAKLGQPVVVENRPGASGNIGTAAVAASAPDGYTLLLGFDGTMVINPHVYAKLPWDTLRDFAPVTKLGDATLISLPEVPTFIESGLVGFVVDSWTGILAPARTPRDVVERLQKEILAVLGEPDIRSRYATLGIEPVGNTPGEFTGQIRADLARWEKVVKQANVRIE